MCARRDPLEITMDYDRGVRIHHKLLVANTWFWRPLIYNGFCSPRQDQVYLPCDYDLHVVARAQGSQLLFVALPLRRLHGTL